MRICQKNLKVSVKKGKSWHPKISKFVKEIKKNWRKKGGSFWEKWEVSKKQKKYDNSGGN